MENNNPLKIHLIAMGGAIMHNLAIALKRAGHLVTGSDDEIFDPARTALQQEGLLPDTEGWNAERISEDLDAIILGMHARSDNPELQKAEALGLKIYSFPEFVYEQSQDKKRVVIAGSHGKTSITAMIMHVLRFHQQDFDFLVGAKVKGFDLSVKLSDAPVIIIEGDEYLNSALDRVPKFVKYHHHIALISGIAWDHFNVFPKLDEYIGLFETLADLSPKEGALIYNCQDPEVNRIGQMPRAGVAQIPYQTHPYTVREGKSYLMTEEGDVPVAIIGAHNMENLAGAKGVCQQLGISDVQFYEAMRTFETANKRLTILKSSDEQIVYHDFAHSPSKVKATAKAVQEQFPQRAMHTILELHTFSSLNKDFLPQYADALAGIENPVVFVNKSVLEHKGLPPISEKDIKNAFAKEDICYLQDPKDLQDKIESWSPEGNLLIMTSGNLGGINLQSIADRWVK